jgi:hypothetical protein
VDVVISFKPRAGAAVCLPSDFGELPSGLSLRVEDSRFA